MPGLHAGERLLGERQLEPLTHLDPLEVRQWALGAHWNDDRRLGFAE
jgi:hypothetical protein